MPFPEALRRMDDTVFRVFGEEASYESRFGQRIEPVRIIRKQPDEDVRFADSRVIVPTCKVRVLRRELAEPGTDDIFILIEDGAELRLIVTDEPQLNARRTIWTMGAEVEDVAR